MSVAASIVWFRQDLRLQDNPALDAAVERGGPVIPVFVWSPETDGTWAPGAASRWWLQRSLQALAGDLRRRGSQLIIRRGQCPLALWAVAHDAGAAAIFWNRRYEPAARHVEQTLQRELRAQGLSAVSFQSGLLVEPEQLVGRRDKPYRIFTAFWKTCQKRPPPASPLPIPARLAAPMRWPESVPLGALRLEPTMDWAAGLRQTWTPGEEGAWRAVERLLEEMLPSYVQDRDRLAIGGTSRLSAHLHFGEIGPRQLWHAIETQSTTQSQPGWRKSATAFIRQLYWREFAYHLLWHFPHTDSQPLHPQFTAFPWRYDARGLRAWQRGRTGYPLIDAAMRELWASGWMHNRLRMIVASFLVKDLLIPWQLGTEWFWDTLVDADLANNSLGWQWAAGCGADAAPFFRIFNPVLQGKKFDPHGAYVRRWVPELERLPAAWIHQPWRASDAILKQAGVVLGETYPRPIVDHAQARARALAALSRMKQASKA